VFGLRKFVISLVGAKPLLMAGNLQEHLLRPGPGFRNNAERIVGRNGTNTLEQLLISRTIGQSYLEVGKGIILQQTLTNIAEYPMGGVSMTPTFPGGLFSPEKIIQIYNEYSDPRLFYTEIEREELILSKPRRKKAQTLLTDSETVLLKAIQIHFNIRKKSTTVNVYGRRLEITIADIRESINVIAESMYTDSLEDRNRVKKEANDRLLTLNINYFNERELPFAELFGPGPSRSLQHLAVYAGKDEYLHHAIFIGNRLMIDSLSTLIPGQLFFSACNSIKHIESLLDFAISKATTKNNKAHIFIIPYDNPYPTKMLRRRAFWTLGTYNWDPFKSNCESVASWVFENAHGPPSFCVVANEREKFNTTGFWSKIEKANSTSSSASSSTAEILERKSARLNQQGGVAPESVSPYIEYNGDLKELQAAYDEAREDLQPLTDERFVSEIVEKAKSNNISDSEVLKQIEEIKDLFSLDGTSEINFGEKLRKRKSRCRKSSRRGSKKNTLRRTRKW